MRAVSLVEFGDSVNFQDLTLPTPEVGPKDVLIRVRAASFNPIDFQIRQYGLPSMNLPVTLGFDVAGTVAEVGAEVDTVAIGDAVTAYLGGPSLAGGYAEYVAIPHWFVARTPDSLSFMEAASIPLTGLTALQCLKRTGIGRGKSLFVAGGAGGAGSWAIQIAKALGVGNIVTTAGSATSQAYLTEVLGLKDQQIVRYPDVPYQTLVRAACDANDGRLFDVALDCVGGAMTSLCCDVVDFQGQVVSIASGPTDGAREPVKGDVDVLFDKSASFHCELVYALAEYGPIDRQGQYAQQLTELLSMIASGAVALPKVTNVGPLSAETVRKAHALLEGSHSQGKLVMTIG